ncbi:MAG: hypothetical protein RDU89_02460 [bacterium]|nr:hypothetical protein [bacterium]
MRRIVPAVALVLFALLLSGCITVHPGSMSGDLVVVGGSGTVPAGTTVDNAVVIGGRLDILGVVRDAAVSVGGDVLVRSGAVVGGDVVAVGGRVIVEEGAQARGGAISLGLRSVLPRSWWWPVPRLPTWIGLLVLALATVALWGRNVAVTAETIAREPARSALTGLLVFLALPFTLLLLVVMVLGIPLVPVVLFILVAAYFFGFTALAGLLGGGILRLLKVTTAGGYWPVVAGVVSLGLLRLVPLVSGIVGIAITLLGLGATLATRFGTRRPWAPPPPTETGGEALPPGPAGPGRDDG